MRRNNGHPEFFSRFHVFVEHCQISRNSQSLASSALRSSHLTSLVGSFCTTGFRRLLIALEVQPGWVSSHLDSRMQLKQERLFLVTEIFWMDCFGGKWERFLKYRVQKTEKRTKSNDCHRNWFMPRRCIPFLDKTFCECSGLGRNCTPRHGRNYPEENFKDRKTGGIHETGPSVLATTWDDEKKETWKRQNKNFNLD